MTDGANVALLALTLILPLSALIARRLPVGDVIKMALAWIAIFAVLIAAVSLWHRVTTEDRSVNATVTTP